MELREGVWVTQPEDESPQERRAQSEAWWSGWDLSKEAPASRKPTLSMIEWAISRWGDPPDYCIPYVEAVRRGEHRRGKGAPRLPLSLQSVFEHHARAWVVATLVERDKVPVSEAMHLTAKFAGVSYETIRAYWYGEGGKSALRKASSTRPPIGWDHFELKKKNGKLVKVRGEVAWVKTRKVTPEDQHLLDSGATFRWAPISPGLVEELASIPPRTIRRSPEVDPEPETSANSANVDETETELERELRRRQPGGDRYEKIREGQKERTVRGGW